jgi:hypothetical protein
MKHIAAFAIGLLLLGACSRGESRRAAPQDTSFAGTTAAINRARPGAPPVILRAVQAASHPGYDRVVFEFAGDSVPGYHVEYASKPVRQCGSGNPVSIAGAGRLVVRFQPAQAHDDRGNPTLVERDRTPALAGVKQMKLVCDFEGQVEWVIGVAAAGPYRVLEIAGPGRLVLDVRHGP